MKAQSISGETASRKFSRRVAYSFAAGAVAGAANDAQALIIYSGIEDQVIARGLEAFNLRIDPDTYIDLKLKNYIFTPGGVPTNYQGIFMPYGRSAFVGFRATGLNYVRALEAGYEVNMANTTGQCPGAFEDRCSQGSMALGTVNPNAEFVNVENAYIGFRFMTNIQPDWEQRIPHFGWARVSIDNAAGTFTLHEWAYESVAETPILTGDRGAAGDFNDDGVVDAADYTVWRNNLGTNHILGGHGDETGASLNVVDQEDYDLWEANYGWKAPVEIGAGGFAPVPEPTTLGFLAAGALGLLALRRNRG